VTAHPLTVGDLEILHALKAGGMGEVLLARRRGPAGFEQLCAIKTIRPELAAAPLVRAMFLDEARLLARLTHPAIAQILDFGEQGGTVYMVMEYVAGEHFRRFAERRPPPGVVCQAVAAACRGLHAAHELRDLGDGHLLGVVHRDISPDNLMLGFDGRVKVLDFGIALVKGRQAPATELGVLKGKPPYMSPEQLRNHELDRRSDVFSIAAVLHELLTGQHLFTGDSIYAVAYAVEHQVIAPPSAVAGPLPADLDDVVMAGLERDRDRRLRSAAAMAEVLERIAAQAGGESLEAWAERELADDRDGHRRWMAGVLRGTGAITAGRPTGVVTALADPTVPDAVGDPHAAAGAGPPAATEVDPRRDEAVRATMLAEVSSVGPSTAASPDAGIAAIAAAQAEPAVPTMARALGAGRRRRAWPIVVAVLLGGLAIGLLIVALGRDAGRVAPRALDAAVDAPVGPIDGPPPPVDGAVVVLVPVDAGPVDVPGRDARDVRDVRDGGGPRPPAPVDAGPRPRPDAAAATATAVDAATPAAGTGYIGVHATPSATARIDGEDWGPTPWARRPIAAGRHTVVFVDAVDGHELYREVVEIEPGVLRKVVWPRPTRGGP